MAYPILEEISILGLVYRSSLRHQNLEKKVFQI